MENTWNFHRSVALNISNTIKHLIRLITPRDFFFEDNCNSLKNLSLVIHVPFPKRHLTNQKKNYSCYGFLEIRQEPIKRTSLNTRILIVVFNEILIPEDSFSRTIVTRQRIHRQKFATTFYSKFHIFALLLFYFILFIFICVWKTWKIIIKPHTIPKWCIKIKILEKIYQNNSYQNTNRNDN